MRARIPIASVLVSALFWPPPAEACTCKKPIPSFWKAAEEGPVVVVAEATRYIRRTSEGPAIGFEIRVIEVVKGDESRKTVELVNLRPTSCDMIPTGVDIGSRYAIVLRPGAVSEGTFSNCRPSVSRIVEQEDGRGVTMEQLRRHPWDRRKGSDNRRP